MIPTRAGESWSKSEDNQLKGELFLGISLETIAETHKRTTGAIVSRVEKFITDASIKGTVEMYWRLKYEAAIRELEAFNVRNTELMAQNDELSDRIHLDLDPCIKRLTLQVNDQKDLAERHKRQSITIGALQEKVRNLVAERDSYKASDAVACADIDDLENANDKQALKIDVLKTQLARQVRLTDVWVHKWQRVEEIINEQATRG